MSRITRAAPVALLALLACREAPTEPTSQGLDPSLSISSHGLGGAGIAVGAGTFDAGADVPVRFLFSAIAGPRGRAVGVTSHETVLGGLTITFKGRVTCVTFDPVNRRAWVAGVITKNTSTHPSFSGAIHQPGRDIWFRVVDYGHGPSAPQPDRTTFVGFQGSAGIQTSAEYCATKPWPANDERTAPIDTGAITVLAK